MKQDHQDVSFDADLQPLLCTRRAGTGVEFLPWIGAHYREGIGHGLKILIIGDSHYENPGDTHTPEQIVTLTRDQITLHLAGLSGGEEFFAKTRGLFGGDAVADFWEHVAFCNIIPEVLSAARERKSDSQYRRGEKIVGSIAGLIRPDIALVLGDRAWGAMSNTERLGTLDLNPLQKGLDRDPRRIWALPGLYPDVIIPAIHVHHPSSSANYDIKMWGLLVSAFMEWAQKWHATRAKHELIAG